eukprot:TRINITY_DN276_c0_g1_i16.p1 TRINITY_DN276_c0_g1~~TRINITY_DN276_c0_g1_i16.p1  ORF type:complete len:615 (+),score=71.13 TRINITY_DN276_c0_g1_i16:571-2415(+)
MHRRSTRACRSDSSSPRRISNDPLPFWPGAYVRKVNVTYEMYQGIPVVSKWVTVGNTANNSVLIDNVYVEQLATNQHFTPVAFAPYGSTVVNSGTGLLHIELDFEYASQIEWLNQASGVPNGMAAGSSMPLLSAFFTEDLRVPVSASGAAFVSFRVMELVFDDGPEQGSLFSVYPDSENNGGCTQGPCTPGSGSALVGSLTERRGLARRRMLRTLAPHITENPIFMHLSDSSEETFMNAINQMKAVGFEMAIYSFGSGFDIENLTPSYLASVKKQIDYAHAAGIEVGAYDLIAWTRDAGHGEQWQAVDPSNGKPTGDACFASGWNDFLLEDIQVFMNATGLTMVETDGPYPGYPCANTSHVHHHGVGDSVYQQTRLQSEFYQALRDLDVYIHAPDFYFFAGINKQGIGYDEDQFSLPRWQQLHVTRTTIYEQTYSQVPTQGWSFVPLVDYHGGGDAASFEPLSQHFAEYEWALAQHLGAGVAACYRGYRLFDTPAVQTMVTKWVSIYKKYRLLLISDIIHIRRPDLQGVDAFVHVNPALNPCAFLMVFNPTMESINTTIAVPLYFAGVSANSLVSVSQEDNSPVSLLANSRFRVTIPLSLGAQSLTWFVLNPEA